MCPKLIELLSWNGPTVQVCCFMLARASTKTFVSRVQKTAEKKESSLAYKFVSRVTRQPRYHCIYAACHFLATNSPCAPNPIRRLPPVTDKQRNTIFPECEGKVQKAKLSLTTPWRYVVGGEVWHRSLTLTLEGVQWLTSGIGQLNPEKQPQHPLGDTEAVWSFWE